jgi:hypothetical protein
MTGEVVRVKRKSWKRPGAKKSLQMQLEFAEERARRWERAHGSLTIKAAQDQRIAFGAGKKVVERNTRLLREGIIDFTRGPRDLGGTSRTTWDLETIGQVVAYPVEDLNNFRRHMLKLLDNG